MRLSKAMLDLAGIEFVSKINQLLAPRFNDLRRAFLLEIFDQQEQVLAIHPVSVRALLKDQLAQRGCTLLGPVHTVPKLVLGDFQTTMETAHLVFNRLQTFVELL